MNFKVTHRRDISANKNRSGSPIHDLSIWFGKVRVRIHYTDNQSSQDVVNRLINKIQTKSQIVNTLLIDSCETIYL